jgi:hypothetical protein
MAFVAPLIPYIMAATAVVGAVGQYQQGRAQDDVAKYEAEQMRANAERTLEDGRKRARETRRQKEIYLSNARAAQAGLGGTTTDAGALGDLGRIGGIFEYNAMEELYGANLDANAMGAQAHAREFEGRMAKRTGTVGAVTTLASAATSIYTAGAGTAKTPAPVTTSLPSYSTTSYPTTITRKLPSRSLS